MVKIIKYWILPIVVFLFLFIFTLALLPVLLNVEKYSHLIEEQLSAASGRTVELGSDLSLSFFPWLSLSVSDVVISNPEGFRSDYLAKFESFEARMKLFPLLKREFHFSRFVVGGLDLNLEKSEQDKVNWLIAAKSAGTKEEPTRRKEIEWRIPVKFSLFVVTDGTVRWLDRSQDGSHTIENLMILISDFNTGVHTPVEAKGIFDGKSFSLEGKLTPRYSRAEGAGVNVDVGLNIADGINSHITGKLNHLTGDPRYDLNIHLRQVSVEDLFALGSVPFSETTTELVNIEDMDLKARLQGNSRQLSVDQGRAEFDDSKMEFSFSYKMVDAAPKLQFSAQLDYLQLEDYLPENSLQSAGAGKNISATEQSYDRGSKGSFVKVDGILRCDELKIGDLSLTNLHSQISRTDRRKFRFEPLTLDLYAGKASGLLAVDASLPTPKTHLEIQAENVQVAPFVKDLIQAENISGKLSGEVVLDFVGSDTDSLLTELSGRGKLLFVDGELSGDDIGILFDPADEQGAQSEEKSSNQSAGYSEIVSEITIENGLLDTRKSSLNMDFGLLSLTGTTSLISRDFALQIQAPAPQASDNNEMISDATRPVMIVGNFNGSNEINVDAQKFLTNSLDLPKEVDVKTLVDEKLPSPEDEDVKDLEGKSLIDPAIVVERFRLQPERLLQRQAKKHLKLGSGKVHIRELVEESSL